MSDTINKIKALTDILTVEEFQEYISLCKTVRADLKSCTRNLPYSQEKDNEVVKDLRDNILAEGWAKAQAYSRDYALYRSMVFAR